MESVAAGLNQVITLASPGVVVRLERVLPSDRRPRADAIFDRQPAGHRSAEPRLLQSDLAGRRPVDGSDHRRRARRIWRQEQPRRAHRHQVGSRPTEADRQRRSDYGSFKSPAFEANIGGGSHTVGELPVGQRACGPTGSSIRRNSTPCTTTGPAPRSSTAWTPTPATPSTFHLNVQAARSSFDVPNTFDQNDCGQDQHQKINTFNVAPGYSQVIGAQTLFTANAFVRQDHLTYTPSADPFADQPASVSQDRKLTNSGVKADVAHTTGAHNVKFGGTIGATKLDEELHASASPIPTSTRLTARTSTRTWRRTTSRAAARRSPTRRRRPSSSRRPTSRTTSRRAMPPSSSACGSITTTA